MVGLGGGDWQEAWQLPPSPHPSGGSVGGSSILMDVGRSEERKSNDLPYERVIFQWPEGINKGETSGKVTEDVEQACQTHSPRAAHGPQ